MGFPAGPGSSGSPNPDVKSLTSLQTAWGPSSTWDEDHGPPGLGKWKLPASHRGVPWLASAGKQQPITGGRELREATAIWEVEERSGVPSEFS